MLLAEIVATSESLAREPSRNAKVRLIAELLRRAAAEVVGKTETARADAGGTDARHALTVTVRLVSGSLRQRRTGIELTSLGGLPGAADRASVTVLGLDHVMQSASELSGKGSAARRQRLFHDLVGDLTAAERRFVIGLLRGGVRQGALESVVMAAVALAAGVSTAQMRRAVTVSGDLPLVAASALVEGPGALGRFTLTVGRGVGPMLAASARSVPEALARTGPAGVEWKLDGIRAQIHKSDDDVRVLTRSLDDITDRVPEVVELVGSLPVRQAIFDGELIALRPDGRPRPFQETGSRTANRTDPDAARVRSPLTSYLFDVLHLDGTDLIDEPGSARRAALEAAVPSVHLTPRLDVGDPDDESQAEAAAAFAADALDRGHEGVVVKADAATYDMGRRGAGWVKVKPVHTLDLVILAVERGSGRRTGWLSNLHLGARDPGGRFGPAGGFVMLGKTFKGLTDEMLRWQTVELPRHIAETPESADATGSAVTVAGAEPTNQRDAGAHVDAGDAGDNARGTGSWADVLRLRPEVVVEIAFDGVQTSPRYPAGVALRFARVVRHRPDKSADDTDTIESVLELRSP